MADLAEAIEGVKPGFVTKHGGRKQVYMLVDLAEREPGRVSLGRLAKEFVLPLQRVLEALTSSIGPIAKHNRWALEDLYQEEALIYDEGLGGTTVPSALADPPKHTQSQKRQLLRDTARGSTRVFLDGRRERPHESWSLANTGTIALPISKGFRTTIERYKEYVEAKPEFDAFAKLVNTLLRDVATLRDALRELAASSREGLRDLAALTALHGVVDIECAASGDTGVGPMEDLQEFIVGSATPLFIKRLIQEPAAAEDALTKRDAAAKRILDAWATDAWKDGAQAVMDHAEVVDHELWEDTFHAVESATNLLPLTGLRARFLEEQFFPLEYQAWKEELDPAFHKLISATLSKEAASQYIDGWKHHKPLSESVLSIMSSLANTTIAMGANLPGPMSLWVAVTRLSLFHSIAHKAKSPLLPAPRSEWVINRIVKMSKLNLSEQKQFAFAVGEAYEFRDASSAARYKHSVKLLGVDWDSRLFRGAGLRGATAFIAAALLALTLNSDPDESLKSSIGLISAMGLAGLAFADLGPISDFLLKRSPRLATLGMAGVAGFISILGVVSGVLTMRDGILRDDNMQLLEGALSTTGNGLAFIGWLASTAGYVPVPQYLMVLGTVLILLSIGVAVWGMLQNSVEEFVLGIIEHLKADGSVARAAGLGPTITILEEMVDKAHFAQLSPLFIKDFEARGFPTELAEGLCS